MSAKPLPLDEQLAKLSYETTRAWNETKGEPAKKRWDQAEPWRRQAAVESVRKAIAGATAPQLHESWREERLKEGWRYGDKKSDEAKTNPALQPYSQLADTQKRAADLFAAVVHTVYKCGTERWSVKTMTDPQAGKVTLTPVGGTVAALNKEAKPVEPIVHREQVELKTLQVKGKIVVAKLEKDKDIHMVLRDPQTKKTMIIESVSPDCAAGSVVASQITKVREDVEAKFPEAAVGGRQETDVDATVTGVGFFDRIHGQEGVADNGIELHPVLEVKFGG
jgi:RyR domain